MPRGSFDLREPVVADFRPDPMESEDGPVPFDNRPPELQLLELATGPH